MYMYLSVIKAVKSLKTQLWIDSLNSDGQQFQQYQQNELSPLTSIHGT